MKWHLIMVLICISSSINDVEFFHVLICVCVCVYILEKEMATHSSTLAWKIPWMEEAGRLQSKVSQRVGHD